MLGILVAFIKMMDLGNLVTGMGLWCFVGLLVATSASIVTFDHHLAWKMFEEFPTKEKGNE